MDNHSTDSCLASRPENYESDSRYLLAVEAVARYGLTSGNHDEALGALVAIATPSGPISDLAEVTHAKTVPVESGKLDAPSARIFLRNLGVAAAGASDPQSLRAALQKLRDFVASEAGQLLAGRGCL